MSQKFVRSLRGMFLIIPLAFIAMSIISNCTNGGVCTGSVSSSSETECADYAADNGCEQFSFDNGVCDVVNCDSCEIVIDDLDPVFDIDDGDVIDDVF